MVLFGAPQRALHAGAVVLHFWPKIIHLPRKFDYFSRPWLVHMIAPRARLRRAAARPRRARAPQETTQPQRPGVAPTPPPLCLRALQPAAGCALDLASRFERLCGFSHGFGSKLTAIPIVAPKAHFRPTANTRHSRLKRECPVPLRRGQTSALCVHCAPLPLACATRRLMRKHQRRPSNRSEVGEKILEGRSDPPTAVDRCEIGDTPGLR